MRDKIAAGEFKDIASVEGLPGMPRAVLQSLDATWRADIDLASLPKNISRLADLDLLLQRIKDHNLPQDAFEWYLDLRRYGTVPHGGFGMGIERCVAWVCGLEHVRETIAFPRMLYRLRP